MESCLCLYNLTYFWMCWSVVLCITINYLVYENKKLNKKLIENIKQKKEGK